MNVAASVAAAGDGGSGEVISHSFGEALNWPYGVSHNLGQVDMLIRA
jgi:hypothetical protein